MWREQVPHLGTGFCALVPWIFLFRTYKYIYLPFHSCLKMPVSMRKKNFCMWKDFFYLNPKVQFSLPVCAQQAQGKTTFPMTNVISVILIVSVAASKFFPAISCLVLFGFIFLIFFIREYILYAGWTSLNTAQDCNSTNIYYWMTPFITFRNRSEGQFHLTDSVRTAAEWTNGTL